MRYAIFAFEDYYPSGGWKDYIGSVIGLNEAKVKLLSSLKEKSMDRGHVVDLELKEIVLCCEYNYWNKSEILLAESLAALQTLRNLEYEKYNKKHINR